jgi:CHAT domain/NACHT domain
MIKDFRTGREIAKELAQGGVKTVILNACDSANFEASSPESNLAEILLRCGTQHVLAMAYKVVEEAVEIFMNAFYQSLLINNAPVEEASRIARLALINNRRRRAIFMYNVDLSDYIVPVFYTSATTSKFLSRVENEKYGSTISSYLDKALSSIKNLSPFEHLITEAFQPVDQILIGRDIDVLSLEFLLSTSRLVLLHGQGGCGKTEFLRYVCQWWKASGWINGSAYIDFAADHSLSWREYMQQILIQLGLDLDKPSEEAIIDRLKTGKYLLAFDSADVFESPLYLENPHDAEEMATSLRALIDSATNDGSVVIVASRHDNTQVANVTSERQKFHLSGLSVLDSVLLLQQLAFEKKVKRPEIYHRRDNIDFLRRVAILLEGNPTAIQMIVPAFNRANYDGEILFNKLLYDKIDEPTEDIWSRSRFCTSLSIAMVLPSFIDFDKTMIQTTHFAPFWSIMPKNLNYYYWFFFLFASKYFQEAAYANWISKEWQDIVKDSQMARNLRTYWPEIESKLIRVGILQHAAIIRRDSQQVPCYHVNPVYILLSRASINKAAWKEAKFAYIRQALLWTPQKPLTSHEYLSEWASVVWDGIEQHEDLLHNRHAQAMGWANQDGDLEEQTKRMGVTLFSLHYGESLNSWWTKPRQRRLVIPHIREHLSHVYIIANKRPAFVPTTWELGCIMNYSWALYQIDIEDTVQSGKAPIVKSALDLVSRWKANSPPGTALPPPDEVTWFQLRFAEASIMDRSLHLREAKELFARNLADDPSTTDVGMLNIIRRWHLQNLQNWAGCVVRLAVRDGKVKKKDFNAGMQVMSDLWKSRGIGPTMSEIFSQHEQEIESMKTGDHLKFALELERQSVSNFGNFAKSIIDSPMMDVFADLEEQTGTSLLKFMSQILDSDTPDSREMKTLLGDMESGVHMMAGDTAAASRAMKFAMQREPRRSTHVPIWARNDAIGQSRLQKRTDASPGMVEIAPRCQHVEAGSSLGTAEACQLLPWSRTGCGGG